jgi:small subunit ribosomal protein S6
MPQYELMYLLGSNVADDQVQPISDSVKKSIEDFGGTNIVETQLGKKKLAYPIKKTRNGNYVVVNFTMDSQGVNKLDAKIRTQDTTIIRYLITNRDEHLERMEKDKKAQAKLTRRIPQEGATATPSSPAPKKEAPAIDLAPEDIDAKIEKALSEDITK